MTNPKPSRARGSKTVPKSFAGTTSIALRQDTRANMVIDAVAAPAASIKVVAWVLPSGLFRTCALFRTSRRRLKLNRPIVRRNLLLPRIKTIL